MPVQTAPLACPAPRHTPTRRSRRNGCICPATIEALREAGKRYYQKYRPTDLRRRCTRDPYVDEIAVERACRGDVVELTVEERREAVRRLTARGVPAGRIGELLGVTRRTVQRHQTALRASRQHDVNRETSRETSDQGRTAA